MKKSSKSKTARQKKISADANVETPKPVTTFDLSLTVMELVHLRDLFSVVLPPDMTTTISQALAQAEYRQLNETKLWTKVSKLCKKAGVPLEDGAPDYIVTISSPPPIGVFRLEPQFDSETELQAEEELPEE